MMLSTEGRFVHVTWENKQEKNREVLTDMVGIVQ